MANDWRDDEQLLADLGEALRTAREVPVLLVEAGKAAFAWRTVDAELAALTYDSERSDAVPAGTRAEQAALRSLTFVADELTIEVEVTSDALFGQLVPPQSGQIAVRGRDGATHTGSVDEVGWFVIRPRPAGLFRLQVRTADGRSVITEWATL